MPVPTTYRRSGEQAVASYDYFDIAENTGIKIFYLAQLSGANNFLAGTTDVYSQEISSQITDTSGAYHIIHDRTFETTFNLPKRINGTIYGNIAHAVSNNSTSECDSYIHLTIKKTSGSTTTTLGSASGANMFRPSGSGTTEGFNLVPVTIDNVHFKKDDILKIQVKQYGRRNGGASTPTFGMGHDPKGRTSGTIFSVSTASRVLVPFVLDL